MRRRKIHITKYDKKRLDEIFAVADEFNYRDRNDLKILVKELGEANIVESKNIPPTVVTMNSKLRFRDLDNDVSTDVTLVFPAEANYDAGRLSVLSPIGTAMLGYAEGDTIEWSVPVGKRRIQIEKIIYQPEAAGDFDLQMVVQRLVDAAIGWIEPEPCGRLCQKKFW